MVAGFGLIVSEDTVLVFVSLGVVFGFGVIVSADAVLVFVNASGLDFRPKVLETRPRNDCLVTAFPRG